jgi:type IV secretion system protein VirB6
MTYNGSIIGNLFHLVDQYSAQFVANTYHHLVMQYASVLYIFSTIYVGFVFIEIQRGAREGKDFPFVIVRLVAILTVALNYDYFCLFVYNVFTNGPLELCKAITLSDSASLGSLNISNALDQFLKGGLLEVNKLFSMGGWTNITYTLFGCLILLVSLIAVSIATGLIFLAKIASTVILALSPLFIFLALFDATKGWFNSYLTHLLTYALIPVVTCAVLMIVLSVSTTTIQYMNSDTPSFKLLVPFLIACLVQIWLFLQIPQKCASLASGFSLKGVLSSFREAQPGIQLLRTALLTSGSALRCAIQGKTETTQKNSPKNKMARFKNAGQ